MLFNTSFRFAKGAVAGLALAAALVASASSAFAGPFDPIEPWHYAGVIHVQQQMQQMQRLQQDMQRQWDLDRQWQQQLRVDELNRQLNRHVPVNLGQ